MTARSVTDATARYRRDRTTWVAFAALFAFGTINALLGPSVPYLRQAEHISYVIAALHQVAFAAGGLLAGLFAAMVPSVSRRIMICCGLGVAALAALLLGYGRTAPVTIAAALLLGAFATSALIRVWAALADRHRSHRAVAMTEGEVSVSLAGILTPALISAVAVTTLSWRFAFVAAAVLVACAATAVALTRIPPPHPPTQPAPEPGKRRARPSRTLLVIFTVVGLEFTISFWAASYLHDDVGTGLDTAAASLSGIYAANLVGRLVASRLARRVPARTLLACALGTALLGMPIWLTATSAPVALIGLVLTSAGIGATFPLASSLHVAVSPRTADQALGQILVVAAFGQTVGPLAAGAIGLAAGLRVGLLVAPVLAVTGAVILLSRRAGARR